MLIILLNLICLAIAMLNAIWPSWVFAHPSAGYHGLLWAHVALGMLVLAQPVSTMAQAPKLWLSVLHLPLLPTGIQTLNLPVVSVLALVLVALGHYGMAAAIPCHSIMLSLYRRRYEALVHLTMQPVVERVGDSSNAARVS